MNKVWKNVVVLYVNDSEVGLRKVYRYSKAQWPIIIPKKIIALNDE